MFSNSIPFRSVPSPSGRWFLGNFFVGEGRERERGGEGREGREGKVLFHFLNFWETGIELLVTSST